MYLMFNSCRASRQDSLDVRTRFPRSIRRSPWPGLRGIHCPIEEVCAMAECSDSPLIRKLGIKAAMRILYVNSPPSFAASLGPLPLDVEVHYLDDTDSCDLDFILF